jgi:hypothetical protein
MHHGAVITTSGLGLTKGAGSGLGSGFGASYGGSGGQPGCSALFSNTDSVIGQLDTCAQISDVPSNALGSGGGDGGPAGGGWVLLSATDLLVVDGSVLCDGEDASSDVGAGSGGSVCLKTNALDGTGLIRALGGSSSTTGAAAGGGGRITIITSNIATLPSTMYQGGQGLDSCLVGGAGTFLQVLSSDTTQSVILTVNNADLATFAITPVDGADLGERSITELVVQGGAAFSTSTLSVQVRAI